MNILERIKSNIIQNQEIEMSREMSAVVDESTSKAMKYMNGDFYFAQRELNKAWDDRLATYDDSIKVMQDMLNDVENNEKDDIEYIRMKNSIKLLNLDKKRQKSDYDVKEAENEVLRLERKLNDQIIKDLAEQLFWERVTVWKAIKFCFKNPY